MRTKLTIRVDPALERALDERARLRGQSIAAVVREILDEALAKRPLDERIGRLAGRLGPAQGDPDEWERHLRETNWRS